MAPWFVMEIFYNKETLKLPGRQRRRSDVNRGINFIWEITLFCRLMRLPANRIADDPKNGYRKNQPQHINWTLTYFHNTSPQNI